MLNKIKYQNPQFKRKLQAARGYRRQIKQIPSSKLGIFLAFLRLDSAMAKIFLFISLVLLIYLVYAPNLFTIKNIYIKGAYGEAAESIKQSINDYLSSRSFLPQNNLLLISKKGLTDYLISKNLLIKKIISIKKDFPSSLNVEIDERFDKFLLKNARGIYAISNDGLITRQMNLDGLNATPTADSVLIGINSNEDKIYLEGQRVSDSSYFENLNEILNKAQSELQNPITGIILENFERPDLEVRTQSGFVIKFDTNSDLQKTFWRLKLLLKEVGEARINGVKYIDIRIKDRGYICYKDAPCAREQTIQTASSTPADASSIK